MALRDFTHLEIGQEVDAISGHYVVDKELKLKVGDREVLYILGSATIDKSCCGVGGCRFATVPGFIVEYKTRTDQQGQPVSLVEPVIDEKMEKQIKQQIEQADYVQQVNFW